jgi:succinate dehydrogenase hydrophobic anchor subunit
MGYRTSANGGGFNWLFQRITGILIFIPLAIHLGGVHFGASPVELGSSLWKFFELAFLLLLLYHIFNGFWILIEDYVRTAWLRVSLFGLTWVVGIGLLILGFVTLVPFA